MDMFNVRIGEFMFPGRLTMSSYGVLLPNRSVGIGLVCVGAIGVVGSGNRSLSWRLVGFETSIVIDLSFTLFRTLHE